MRKSKKCLYYVIIMLLLFSGLCVAMGETRDISEKIECDATLSDAFSEEEILLILTEKASKTSKKYTKKDFPEISCETVEELIINKEESQKDHQILRIKLCQKSKHSVLEGIKKLILRDDVLYAGPNYILEVASTYPNDTFNSEQWGINSIDLNRCWDFVQGDSSVTIGVLDTGIDSSHPDLSSVIDYEKSRDFVEYDKDTVVVPEDLNGHGTHVAGIIGAMTNNNRGVSGVCFNVKLASLKVIHSSGLGYVTDVIEGIEFAEDNDIKILNLSCKWYEYNTSTYDPALYTAIDEYTGVFICAAGNENKDNDGLNPAFPASYDLSNLITVGAINSFNQKWDRSNYGAISVDVYAPGVNILSTYPENLYGVSRSFKEDYVEGYAYLTGTSMATPYVTGVVALLSSINPNLTVEQIKTSIIEGATSININVGDDHDIVQTVKKLNAFGAIKYALQEYALDNYALSGAAVSISKRIATTDDYLVNKCLFVKFSKTNYQHGFEIDSSFPVDVTLYDAELEEVEVTLDTSEDMCNIKFNDDLDTGIYYLHVEFEYSTAVGNVNLYIHPHNFVSHYCQTCNKYTDVHSYLSGYLWLSYLQHQASCICGATSNQAHAVLGNAPQVGNYKTCILCGGLAQVGFDFNNPFIKYDRYITSNGSYILPNGTIVLVEDDVEDFLNGNLDFYLESDDAEIK